MFKKLFIPFINFLLYGHFWIAAAALAMALQTRLLLNTAWSWTALDSFIAAGTLGIYALHRLLTPSIVATDKEARFQTVFYYRKHILWYAIVAIISAAYFFLQLSFSLKISLLIPAGLALAYIIPVFKGRRLRDLPYIKIFIIALTWAWITVAAPAKGSGIDKLNLGLMLLERAAFIFAITIPFDIRDLEMDRKAAVLTLPGIWGKKKAKRIAYWSLGLMLTTVFCNTYLGFYSLGVLFALFLSAFSSAYLIALARPDRHDFFYSGLLDGMMIVQFLLICWVL